MGYTLTVFSNFLVAINKNIGIASLRLLQVHCRIKYIILILLQVFET